jgi:hypothetical protein
MERCGSRLSRRGFVVGAAGLGLVAVWAAAGAGGATESLPSWMVRPSGDDPRLVRRVSARDG